MERKNVFITVGIIAALAVTAGIIGGMTYSANQKTKDDTRIFFILISILPVKMKIAITSDTDWYGGWEIDSSGGTETGSMSAVHTGEGTEVRAGYFLTSPGILTLEIFVAGKRVFTNTTVTMFDPLYHEDTTPFKDMWVLALLV